MHSNLDIETVGAFTVNEFCHWAKIGRTKFYSEVSSGRLVVRKAGRKSLVSVKDAEAWLNSLPSASGPNGK